MQEANDSMLTIKRGELSELRNNNSPHPLIKFTLENIVILLGQTQSLQNVKKVLSDTNLLSRLKAIHPSINNVLKVQKRISENPQWSFESVSKVSYGIRYMVKWTKSIIKFHVMKSSLDSERSKVEEYKRELHGLEEKLAGKQSELNSKDYQFRVIEEEYNSNKRELINLQELVTLNNRKYQNAELIKNNLQEEIVNWHSKLEMYKQLKHNVISTSIMLTLYL